MDNSVSNFSEIEIVVFDTIPVFLEEKYSQLKNLSLQTQGTEEEIQLHEDIFCSQEDLNKYVIAFQNELPIGKLELYKRQINFKDEPLILGGIGGLFVTEIERNKDISTNLLKKGIRELKNLGCDLIYMITDIHNPNLMELYRPMGFVRLGRAHTYLGKSGKRYINYNSLVAPANSLEKFAKLLYDKAPFDIGKGNW